ncbi:MAG: FAD-dependent oxidoreductase [Planctomycetes bacterium]|nr:FAD-dependent oxidoreductase [Planctomycetota bacterium]
MAERAGYYPVQIPDAAYWRRQIKCQDACPVHTDARGYVRAIADGDFEAAYLIARGPNPLASICGRVCGAPCEANCRRKELDQAVSIRALKRFVTEKFGPESHRFAPLDLLKRILGKEERLSRGHEELTLLSRWFENTELRKPSPDAEHVGVVGAGPAGLGAAHDLALMGFRVTVYEAEPIPAGMLAVGIPEYRLPRDLINAEIEVIKALGVEFVCNTWVGRDVTMDELLAKHKAVLIAVGAKRSRTVPIPGSDAKGVLGGVEMLRSVALNEPVQMGPRVVVIGGGNVAYDVARTVVRRVGLDVGRTAMRQEGVREVHLCSLENLQEMPADNVEIIEGDEEGIIRHNSLGPKEILTDSAGKVTGIVFKACLSVFDENRRFAPKFDEAKLTTIECDTVLWAVGQRSDLSFINQEKHGIRLTERGGIENKPETLATSRPGVFVAGDIAYGPKLLIHAVASGKQAARSIYQYLRGKSIPEERTNLHGVIAEYARERDYEKLKRHEPATLTAAQRRTSQTAIVEQSFTEAQAVAEGCRCLDCGVNTVFDGEKCVLCGGCVDVCPESCLKIVSLARVVGGDEFDQLKKNYCDGWSAGDADASAIIKDETICIRCALCAERCPNGAITMERFSACGVWS